MREKLERDIAKLCGVPYELIGGGYGSKAGMQKALENGRVFVTNMLRICMHLEALLTDVYLASFGGEPSDVQFTLKPTPRIEVESVEQLILLMEAGLVSAENAHDYSNLLLGVDIKQHTGKFANAGTFTQTHVTPAQKRENMLAKSTVELQDQQRRLAAKQAMAPNGQPAAAKQGGASKK